MESIDQGAATTSYVGDNVVVESGVPYSSHSPPSVQQPSLEDSSFHSPMEGHVDDTTRLDYGPNAPFWDTSIGQAIASFGTHLNSSEDEEERRQYRASILCANIRTNTITLHICACGISFTCRFYETHRTDYRSCSNITQPRSNYHPYHLSCYVCS